MFANLFFMWHMYEYQFSQPFTISMKKYSLSFWCFSELRNPKVRFVVAFKFLSRTLEIMFLKVSNEKRRKKSIWMEKVKYFVNLIWWWGQWELLCWFGGGESKQDSWMLLMNTSVKGKVCVLVGGLVESAFIPFFNPKSTTIWGQSCGSKFSFL